MDKVHSRMCITPSASNMRYHALFNMEVSILERMDWRIGSALHPTSSELLFLTGLMGFKMPEESMQALHHLIVSTHMTPSVDQNMLALRREHPYVLALACLASTLLLSVEAVENMCAESKVDLLRDVASKLDIEGGVQDDSDFLVCPVIEQQKAPYVKAMEQIARAVCELQEIAEADSKKCDEKEQDW
jgi:hypothetical protein